MVKWKFEVHAPAPDTRVWQFDDEHQAKGFASRFNLYIPRGGKLAKVVVLPQ